MIIKKLSSTLRKYFQPIRNCLQQLLMQPSKYDGNFSGSHTTIGHRGKILVTSWTACKMQAKLILPLHVSNSKAAIIQLQQVPKKKLIPLTSISISQIIKIQRKVYFCKTNNSSSRTFSWTAFSWRFSISLLMLINFAWYMRARSIWKKHAAQIKQNIANCANCLYCSYCLSTIQIVICAIIRYR